MRMGRHLYVVLALAIACLLGGCSEGSTHAATEGAAPIAYIGAWGVKGDGPGQLDQPTCIATDSVGDAYIADAGSYFIHKFDPEGTPLLSFQDTAVKNPQSITVDGGGAIYVTDSVRSSAFVFFPNGDRYRELKLKGRSD